MADLEAACQREDSAKAGNFMRPYVAESWKETDLTSWTMPCSLGNAAQKLAVVVALQSVLLFLPADRSDPQNSGALGSGGREWTTRTPTRARVESIVRPRMADIDHGAHTHATSNTAAAVGIISHES